MPVWHDKNFVYTLTKIAWETISLGSPQFENRLSLPFPSPSFSFLIYKKKPTTLSKGLLLRLLFSSCF